MRKLPLTVALTALLAAAPAAAAPSSGATMNADLTPWVLLAPYAYGAGGGFGLGLRYQVAVAPRGLLHLANGVHDEFGIEFGADWVHYRNWDYYGYNWAYDEFSPTVGLAWNFWLTPQLALYPKIDLAFRFGTWSRPPGYPYGYPYGHPGGYGGVDVELAAGLAFRIANRVALRAEANTYALCLGVAFKL